MNEKRGWWEQGGRPGHELLEVGWRRKQEEAIQWHRGRSSTKAQAKEKVVVVERQGKTQVRGHDGESPATESEQVGKSVKGRRRRGRMMMMMMMMRRRQTFELGGFIVFSWSWTT